MQKAGFLTTRLKWIAVAQVNELNLNVLNNKFFYLNIDLSMLTGKVNAMTMQYIHVSQGLGTKDMIYCTNFILEREC